MSDAKKLKYLTKTVHFGSSTVTLYSIDGFTWSSKKHELTVIKERLENQRVTLGEIKSEDGEDEKAKPEKDDEPVVTSSDDDELETPKKGAAKDDDEDEEEDDIVIDEDIDLDEDLDDDDLPAAPKKSKIKGAKYEPEPELPPQKSKKPAPPSAPKKNNAPSKIMSKKPAPKPARKQEARSKKRAA